MAQGTKEEKPTRNVPRLTTSSMVEEESLAWTAAPKGDTHSAAAMSKRARIRFMMRLERLKGNGVPAAGPEC